MFTLSPVFTSGALFQAEAALTIRGIAAPDTAVSGCIADPNGSRVCSALTNADADGRFVLELRTPAASYAEYTVTLRAGGDEHKMERVLFGELWLASGQSNMELSNGFHPDFPELFERMKGKQYRVFSCAYPSYGGGGEFPWEPDTLMAGEWCTPSDFDKLGGVSAAATKFIDALYDFLNEHADVPVGFLNNTWGGTSMPSWFPRDAVEKDEHITEVLRRVGAYPTPENWNTRGDCNFQQTCAQYNVKIANVEGLKVRGVIWYQGENEAGGEYWNHVYADYLRFYQKTYAERFGADPAHFMMISSLIYPWTYGGSGECSVGYLNNAFVETAAEAPDKFAFAPIGDLEPVWGYHQFNHPIHPTHKYFVGERMARLAIANVYGGGGQTSPAILSSWEVLGNRLRLHFASVGTGLRVEGSSLRGLYVAGEDELYLPAEYEILSPDTMDVWCEEIPEPVYAAYGVQSLEPKVSLFAGDYPAAPFFTDRKHYLNIEQRTWYDTAADSRWVTKMRGDVLDLFFHPVWQPSEGSEVCRDTAFRLRSAASLRVSAECDSDGSAFGCFVKSYPYHRLDFAKYAALRVSLFNTEGLSASLILETADGSVTLPFVKIADEKGGWSRWEAEFGALPESEITRMVFTFCRGGDRYAFVNLERPRLMKK